MLRKLLISVCLFVLLQNAKAQNESLPLHPDTGLDIHQFLAKYEYPLESHQVETEDGYLLTVHRIPYGRNQSAPSNITRPAVLIQHGLLSSSMDWLNLGPDKALGLKLADAGYDVWLGNSRGTRYSRNHTTLDPNQNATFWDFSYHEMGVLDLPAVIDHILELTGLTDISYIGHSQGTTEAFVLASMKPEYNEKLNLITALAPVTYIHNATGPLLKLYSDNKLLVDLAVAALNLHEILPYSLLIPTIANEICNDNSEYQEACALVLFLLAGFDSPQLNRTFITVIATNAPAGVAYKQLQHFIQGYQAETFRQYDYGALNFLHYGQLNPPDYDLSKVTAPVALYYGGNDFFAPIENVERLESELSNVVKSYLVPFNQFNHIDFLWATELDTLVNNDVVELVQKYSPIN